MPRPQTRRNRRAALLAAQSIATDSAREPVRLRIGPDDYRQSVADHLAMLKDPPAEEFARRLWRWRVTADLAEIARGYAVMPDEVEEIRQTVLERHAPLERRRRAEVDE